MTLRDPDAGDIAIDHLPEHVLLVPIRDEDSNLGERGVGALG
jgi:hypothetical protein